jgi:hypothetical protein
METLKKHGLEAAASIWLIVVAVEYISRYFQGIPVDFAWVYYAMLVVTAACVVAAVVKSLGDRRRRGTPGG